MPVSPAYRPDPRYPALGPEFADPVRAEAFPKTILRFRNDRAAATVGLDELSDEEWIAHFGRFEPLPGNIDPPLAQRYHGHQFRTYNPELGDGRGFTFAQMRGDRNRQAAGPRDQGLGAHTVVAGPATARLTLKGGVRRGAGDGHAGRRLGVPTSRSFSLIETGEDLGSAAMSRPHALGWCWCGCPGATSGSAASSATPSSNAPTG